uniref:Helicase C-terminal domain-containing protein n=1 Tax=Oryza punctata TaxID=4537 RepID=A0A0E0M763_ORYPU
MRSPAAASAATEFSDALPSPTSPAATPSHHSSGRHFYLAVDRLQFKMRTVLELLGVVADRRGALPIAVCVSSRDELDLVSADVASLPFVSLSPLYSDQAEAERASVFDKFRQATIQWTHTKAASDIMDNPKTESADSKLTIVVATDACLPQATLGEAPLMAHMLINYELPTKKGSPEVSIDFFQEAYFRRMSTCLAADGIVINMVVGGEVATLKALEETSGLLIAEMPIHVSEIL